MKRDFGSVYELAVNPTGKTLDAELQRFTNWTRINLFNGPLVTEVAAPRGEQDSATARRSVPRNPADFIRSLPPATMSDHLGKRSSFRRPVDDPPGLAFSTSSSTRIFVGESVLALAVLSIDRIAFALGVGRRCAAPPSSRPSCSARSRAGPRAGQHPAFRAAAAQKPSSSWKKSTSCHRPGKPPRDIRPNRG